VEDQPVADRARALRARVKSPGPSREPKLVGAAHRRCCVRSSMVGHGGEGTRSAAPQARVEAVVGIARSKLVAVGGRHYSGAWNWSSHHGSRDQRRPNLSAHTPWRWSKCWALSTMRDGGRYWRSSWKKRPGDRRCLRAERIWRGVGNPGFILEQSPDWDLGGRLARSVVTARSSRESVQACGRGQRRRQVGPG
jgi:hypothetical protein